MRYKKSWVGLWGLIIVVGLWLLAGKPSEWPRRPPIELDAAKAGRGRDSTASRLDRSAPVVFPLAQEAARRRASGATPVAESSADLAARLNPFDTWLRTWLAAEPGSQRALEAEGVAAATARRAAMRALIAQHPRLALERSVPTVVWETLPAVVRAQLETRFDARGDFEVTCSCFGENHAHGGEQRTIVIDGQRWAAAVFGRRESQLTKRGLPLHGVVLDGVAALREEPYRRLDAMELTRLGYAADQTVVRIGAETRELAGAEELALLERSLLAAEALPGPEVRTPANEPARAQAAPTAWTTGEKKVLIIRVDFSDLPGDPQVYLDGSATVPLTAQAAVDWMNTRVAPLYHEMSYGKTTLVSTATSRVYRLPETAAAYATANFGVLHQAAQAAAGVDYVLADYDRLVVAFSSLAGVPSSNYGFAGLASRNAKEVWINGNFWCVGHELGHTFGLPHANGWFVTDGDPLSAAGSSTEYGDPFDIMGGAVNYDGRAHFGMWAKNWLGWLADGQVQTITTSGTYRVQRFDHPSAAGTLALKIARGASQHIWIGLRRSFTDNVSLSQGAYVIWGGVTDVASNLIDLTTPGVGFGDAGLGVGRSFSDSVAGVTIKTLAVGGTAPGEYLDVQVTFGPAAPSLYASPGPVATGAGLSALFNVAAGGVPAVAYQWQRRALGAASWSNVANNDTYAGAATNSLLVRAATLAMSGDEFRCVVANSAGQITTNPAATLSVLATGVSTVAGRAGFFGQRDGHGSQATFKRPLAMAYAPDGTLYVAEHLGGIRKVSPSGAVTTLVANAADLLGLAVGADGTLFVSNNREHTLSKITPAGVVSLWVGSRGVAGSADGPAGEARFNGPKGLACDPAGNLFVADFGNRTIRRVSPEGVVSTVAGVAGQQGRTDGRGANARFSYPETVTIDPWGTLFVGDSSAIRRISPDGTVTTLPDPEFQLNLVYGMAADAFGNLWLADWENTRVSRVRPDGRIVAVAGSKRQSGSADGTPEEARFFHPDGLVRDATGALLVADADNYTVRRIVVPGLPQITRPPADQVVAPGQPLSLSVEAANSTGFLYQWFKDGIPLVGATQGTYVQPAAQAADSGSYAVMVGNAEGSVTSRRAQVVVGGRILVPPAGRTVYAGQPVELAVSAVGVGSLTYQWTKDGIAVPGATAATLRLAEAGPAAAGRYAVTVTYSGGSVTSGAADLVVASPVVAWTGLTVATTAEVPAGLGDVRQIAAGYEHALALRADGTVVTWGSTRAALAVPAGLTNVVHIAASAHVPVSGAVKSDGSVILWGDSLYYGPLTVPAGLNNVRQIALGERGFLALRADGTVFSHTFGQTTTVAGPAGLAGVTAIAAGRYHYTALKSDGTVVAWGGFIPAAPAGLTGVVAITAGGYFSAALKSDGTVVAWGDAASAGNGEIAVPAWLTGVRAICAAGTTTLALKSDGRLVLWGNGLAPTGPITTPVDFPPELTTVALGRTQRLALVGKGPFVSLPPLRVITPGASNSLAVKVSGVGDFTLQWLKNGTAIPGATSSTLNLSGQASDAGSYQVIVAGAGGSVASDPSAVVPVSFTHRLVGAGYRPGDVVTFSNTVSFAGTTTALKWAVLLPSGWTYVGSQGSEGELRPAAGATDLLDWWWFSPPASPVTFTYDLRVPADAVGRQELVALATVGVAGSVFDFVVRPDPLPIWAAPSHHSADTNRDLRISLVELTRVIELYNTRSGTSRTGAYRVQPDSEDGFAPEPTPAAGAAAALTGVHSADTDRDARISLLELTRVIELYNRRSGTVRTGQYHPQAGTEDGFDPGP